MKFKYTFYHKRLKSFRLIVICMSVSTYIYVCMFATKQLLSGSTRQIFSKCCLPWCNCLEKDISAQTLQWSKISNFYPILDPRNLFALFDGFLFETLFDAREI